MSELSARIARRLAADRGDFVPTTEDNLRIAAENKAHDQQSIAAAPDPVLTTWAEVAASVDETTWQRILTDLSPATRAECERLRPPAPLPASDEVRRAAIHRLGRAHTTNPLLTRRQEPTP
ncbi:hypothetical protein [Micromonospora sp. NBRC 107095]|uniref:hypothetical protein n=1 Tax=Micromonospora sp. NBRC 107095 TaxID=3032209 RepID=UPI0024A2DC11|nr:hypothetical protein [Micromonospora sp. NBRC 107095]GLZ62851.1 hypothetical protein Misp05_64270 [Micromonospora sp. NBRC 107095]